MKIGLLLLEKSQRKERTNQQTNKQTNKQTHLTAIPPGVKCFLSPHVGLYGSEADSMSGVGRLRRDASEQNVVMATAA